MYYIFLLIGVIILGALLITAIVLQRLGENKKLKRRYVASNQIPRARFEEPDIDIVTLQMDPHGVMTATRKASDK